MHCACLCVVLELNILTQFPLHRIFNEPEIICRSTCNSSGKRDLGVYRACLRCVVLNILAYILTWFFSCPIFNVQVQKYMQNQWKTWFRENQKLQAQYEDGKGYAVYVFVLFWSHAYLYGTMSVNIYMCIYIYICLCTCIYIYIYICTYIYVFMCGALLPNRCFTTKW